jgi:hypothetical protein
MVDSLTGLLVDLMIKILSLEKLTFRKLTAQLLSYSAIKPNPIHSTI